MHPLLLSLGPVKIYTYGFCVALAFYVGVVLAGRSAERVGIPKERIQDLAFVLLLSSIVGARLFYVLTNLDTFMADPLEIVRFWNGGLVFYGGFIVATVAGIVYMKKHGMPLWRTGDALAPSLALGHAIGRLGCLFAGCCYGRVCDLPWAMTFTHPGSLAPTGIALHPTQLYATFANLALFGALMMFRRRIRFDGQLFWLYVLLYGIVRSILETFRGDERGGELLATLSVSQSIGFAMGVVAIVMLIRLSSAKKESTR